MQYQRAKRLLIRDEIHGDMTFDPVLERTIDHEYVQRLRGIKQLGLAEYIFPCATHTRFQHSLGAAYLAGRYFKSFTEQWLSSPVTVAEPCEGTTLHTERTYRCIRAVVESSSSRKFWYQVISLAGLLHDVGHGPWSHTFEHLSLEQDFGADVAAVPAPLKAYLERRDPPFMHEDISLLYIQRILADLEKEGTLPEASLFVLPVAALVNRKVCVGEYKKPYLEALEAVLAKHHIEGGADFHRLLSPLISGPFDVDRMDYIQRDGRNSGVSIGAIEWRRIVSKLVPCLAEHSGENEPSDVVLFSSIKNQHVLDDFVFSLFQMYTQVYLHPKIVGLEELIKQQLDRSKASRKGFKVDLKTHASLSDEKLRELFVREFGLTGIGDVLTRKAHVKMDIASYPPGAGLDSELKANGFRSVSLSDRPMMKDSVGVFLYSRFQPRGEDKPAMHHFSNWLKVSPIARHFVSVNYSPNFWIRSE